MWGRRRGEFFLHGFLRGRDVRVCVSVDFHKWERWARVGGRRDGGLEERLRFMECD